MIKLFFVSSFVVVFLFLSCESKQQEKTVKPVIEKKDSLIVPTTMTFIDNDLMFIPEDTRIPILTNEHLNQSDSVLLVQCCQPRACNSCYEFNCTKSINPLADFDRGRLTYYIRKRFLEGKHLSDFIDLNNSSQYFSDIGPESTCCLKYLFLVYEDDKIISKFWIDDCFYTSKGYLTNKGIRKLKGLVYGNGLTFHNYWDESDFK